VLGPPQQVRNRSPDIGGDGQNLDAAVILLAIIVGVAASGYVAQHFAINTDISRLISADL
jgi:hypothetical protein